MQQGPGNRITTTMAQDKTDTAVAPQQAADLSGASGAASKPPVSFEITEKALDDAFNDIWANNANAISHCYSNTDALKVDFTRTGKRSFLGMISKLLENSFTRALTDSASR